MNSKTKKILGIVLIIALLLFISISWLFNYKKIYIKTDIDGKQSSSEQVTSTPLPNEELEKDDQSATEPSTTTPSPNDEEKIKNQILKMLGIKDKDYTECSAPFYQLKSGNPQNYTKLDQYNIINSYLFSNYNYTRPTDSSDEGVCSIACRIYDIKDVNEALSLFSMKPISVSNNYIDNSEINDNKFTIASYDCSVSGIYDHHSDMEFEISNDTVVFYDTVLRDIAEKYSTIEYKMTFKKVNDNFALYNVEINEK